MISSIRLDGTTACMSIPGATHTEVFRASAREVLCPTLRHGDLVIMDNLAPHTSDPTPRLIKEAGARVLFLPAYSPDFNPIETMGRKVQALLRSAEARTSEELLAAIGKALAKVTAKDAGSSLFCVGRAREILRWEGGI